METVSDESFGVVPVIKKDDEWRVLLVHQISYRGKNDRFWTFPKGHSDAGEAPLKTASRELAEETGITDVQLVEEAAFTIAYSFTHAGKRIQKSVTYYLGICSNTKTQISIPEEIAELGWFTFEAAIEKLSHKNTQNVLRNAEYYLKEHRQN